MLLVINRIHPYFSSHVGGRAREEADWRNDKQPVADLIAEC